MRGGWFATAALVFACGSSGSAGPGGDSGSTCQPGSVRICLGLGCPASQTCRADGSAWGECSCNWTPSDGSAGTGGAPADASLPDASDASDASDGSDGSAPICGGSTYNALDDATRWSFFDVSSATPGAKGFQTGAFDGRYVYLVPYSNAGGYDGVVARYDTTLGFGAANAWTTFDVTSVNPGAAGFGSCLFDGRYLYLVPAHNGVDDGIVARYDTTAPFGAAASWTSYDVSTAYPTAKGFVGAAFDGHYAYLVPWNNGGLHGVVARYDTTAALGTASSWSIFDVSTLNPSAKGFYGAAFDGRYVYLVPYTDGAYDGLVVRYDTTLPFASPPSWSSFDAATVTSGARGFEGAAFDGRYVYFVPSQNGASGTLARYDTTLPFGAPGSWGTFDVSVLDPGARGYAGARFDGRYVTLVPYFDGAYHGLVVRYDTTADFAAVASWQVFDVSKLTSGARGFLGGVFDGRYLYFVPSYNATSTPDGLVARFDAASPACLPPGSSASFF